MSFGGGSNDGGQVAEMVINYSWGEASVASESREADGNQCQVRTRTGRV